MIQVLQYIAICVIAIFVIVLPMCYLFSRIEAKAWNKGICPNCGKELKHFADDSQGGHGWCCDECDYYTWVSYHRWVYATRKKHNKKEENDKGATA